LKTTREIKQLPENIDYAARPPLASASPTQDEVARLFGTMEFLYLNQDGFGLRGNIQNISSKAAERGSR